MLLEMFVKMEKKTIRKRMMDIFYEKLWKEKNY